MSNQRYFWTKEWQAGESEADEDIEAGRVERFCTAADAIAHLHSARPTHPGVVLRREMEARGWSTASVLEGLPRRKHRWFLALLNCATDVFRVGPETLATLFGTSVAFWVNLQIVYDEAVKETP